MQITQLSELRRRRFKGKLSALSSNGRISEKRNLRIMNPSVSARFLGNRYAVSPLGPSTIWNRRRLAKGEHLFHAGDEFRGLFQVLGGSFKTLSSTCSGIEQVLDFHIPGEFMGMDAISMDEYPSTAIALEESEVCSISYAALNALCAIHSDVQNNLDRALSREIRRKGEITTLLGYTRPDARIAIFLLDLSRRNARTGRDTEEITLPMKRCDIASFLGMSSETLCRQFAKLQRLGLIRARGSMVRIVDRPRLERFKGSTTDGGFSWAEAVRAENGPSIREISSRLPNRLYSAI